MSMAQGREEQHMGAVGTGHCWGYFLQRQCNNGQIHTASEFFGRGPQLKVVLQKVKFSFTWLIMTCSKATLTLLGFLLAACIPVQ